MIRTIALLAFTLAASAFAHAQQADWDTPIGHSNGTISIQIGLTVRYRVTYSWKLGATTTSYDPVDGTNQNVSKAFPTGTVHVSVRAYDASGLPVIPIHMVNCPGGVHRFSMSQPANGNACANWNEATVTVISN